MSPGPQSEEKGNGEEGCREVKAGTKKKKKLNKHWEKLGMRLSREGVGLECMRP